MPLPKDPKLTANRPPSKPPRLNDAVVATLLAVVVTALLLSFRPIADIPRNDDFSYARTAEALARTGHIAYNGWGSPTMIPQAIVGAALIHVFGFSYRLLEWFGIACASAVASVMFLLCRACGLSRNASLTATAVLVLNSIFLGVAPSFMNDLPSLLLLLTANLVLIRSITPLGEGRVSINRVTFVAAVVLAMVAGSNRQVSWVAFVAALAPVFFVARSGADRAWLIGGAIAVLGCAGVVTAWWSRQLYIVPTDAWIGFLIFVGYINAVSAFTYKFLVMFGLFILPITILGLRKSDFKRVGFWISVALLLLPLPFPISNTLSYFNPYYGASPTGQYFTSLGAKIGFLCPPSTPDIPIFSRDIVRVLVILGALGLGFSLHLMVVWWQDRRIPPADTAGGLAGSEMTRRRLAAESMALTSLVQIVGSLPWFAMMRLFDRYFLFYLPGFLILFLVQASLRKASAGGSDPTENWRRWIATVIIAGNALVGYAIAAEYMNKTGAESVLYHRLRARGVPPEQIDDSFPIDADAQISIAGHVNQRIMSPPGAFDPNARGHNIATSTPEVFPVMDGHFVLTPDPHPKIDVDFDPNPTDQQDYFSFFPPRHRTMYELHVAGTSTAP